MVERFTFDIEDGYVLASDYDALAARLAEAERVIKYANEALHGYGVEDQGEAFDKACRILDSYTSETVPTAEGER